MFIKGKELKANLLFFLGMLPLGLKEGSSAYGVIGGWNCSVPTLLMHGSYAAYTQAFFCMKKRF